MSFPPDIVTPVGQPVPYLQKDIGTRQVVDPNYLRELAEIRQRVIDFNIQVGDLVTASQWLPQ